MQLPITLGTAALLVVLYVGLSVTVTAARIRAGTGLGLGEEIKDDAPSPLLIAVRRHAHFAEYVPYSLILIGLLESWGVGRNLLLGLAGALVLARLLLTIGINAKTPNPFRLAGNALQWGLILTASIAGGWQVLTP